MEKAKCPDWGELEKGKKRTVPLSGVVIRQIAEAATSAEEELMILGIKSGQTHFKPPTIKIGRGC